MNKTIQINPDLFSISKSTKNKSLKQNIKIKVPKEKNDNSLTNKNKLLKYIRRHQNESKKKELQSTDPPILTSDFDDSVSFLKNIAEQLKQEPTPPYKNYTIKNRQDENVSMLFPESSLPLIPVILPIYHSDLQQVRISAPKYGCLKNGNLPTFRQFHGQQTQKQYPISSLNNNLKTLGESSVGGSNDLNRTKNHYNCQKKTLKRTFRIGKSEKNRKISVLVANKTIRNNYFSQKTILKETPLIDVKRYLVKHGLIKIGSIAPPDVLRKMFESASLLCGDVTNHNNETLMYNYLNSDNKIW
jgi:hypothetical protein